MRLDLPALLLALGLALPAQAEPIPTWVRPAGLPAAVEHARPEVRPIDLKGQILKAQELHDLQYGEKRQYKAAPLFELLDGVRPADPKLDGAVLRFSNRMAVLLPLDAQTRSKSKLWLAQQTWQAGDWQAKFPPIQRGPSDPRPLEFPGNKLVAELPYHPHVAEDAEFTPWRHVGALVGVEFVHLAAWDGQYAVDGSLSPQAQPIYKAWCAHCHGIRKTGAGHGWDFVEPLPAVDQRPTVNDLLFHVRFRPLDAPQMGLLMPGMKRFTRVEGERLHAWLKLLADRPLKPYQP